MFTSSSSPEPNCIVEGASQQILDSSVVQALGGIHLFMAHALNINKWNREFSLAGKSDDVTFKRFNNIVPSTNIPSSPPYKSGGFTIFSLHDPLCGIYFMSFNCLEWIGQIDDDFLFADYLKNEVPTY